MPGSGDEEPHVGSVCVCGGGTGSTLAGERPWFKAVLWEASFGSRKVSRVKLEGSQCAPW